MQNTATSQVSNPLVTYSVQDWMKSNGFTQVHNRVRVNTNGYPFVTFITSGNDAENIYFSKEAAKAVSLDSEIKKGFFANLIIAETTNAAGEPRIRIARAGSSSRLEVDDLF